MHCESANAEQAVPHGISVESCQQVQAPGAAFAREELNDLKLERLHDAAALESEQAGWQQLTEVWQHELDEKQLQVA